jgi:hypothetical protein
MVARRDGMRLLLVAAAALLVAGVAACSSADDPGTMPGETPTTEVGSSAPGAAPGSTPTEADAAAPDDDAGAGTGADGDASMKPDAKPKTPPGNGCPALVYPSGVKIQTFKDATTTASYLHHLATGDKAPTCFLDTTNLLDPDTGTVHPLSVMVSTNFELGELVGTEVAQGYGHFVLMAPAAVASLQKFRTAVGVPVSVTSGFRSPKHQESVCESLCGMPLGCPGTCANNSRHMFGDAFDLPLTFYTAQDETQACNDGFKFAYLESGTHLHVDQNPAYETCVKQ